MITQEQVTFSGDEFKGLLKPNEAIRSFEKEHEKEAKADPGFARRVEERHEKNKKTEAKHGVGKWVVWGALTAALLGSCAVTVVGPVGTWINNSTYRGQEASLFSPYKGDREVVGEKTFLNSMLDYRFLRSPSGGSGGFLDGYDYFKNPAKVGTTDKQIFDLQAAGFKKAIKFAASKNFKALDNLKDDKGFDRGNVERNLAAFMYFSNEHKNLTGPDLVIEYYKMQAAKQGMEVTDKTIVDLTELIVK